MITSKIPAFSSMTAVRGLVEFYNDSAFVLACSCSDYLQDFTVDRVGENNKFFGYGICQKATINIIDIEREKDFQKGFAAKLSLGNGTLMDNPYPDFYLEEIERDEDTNLLSFVAYDAIYKAASHTFAELNLTPPYTIRDVAHKCAVLLGLGGLELAGIGAGETCFDTSYESGANFDGTETIREVLDAIAEVTQTIYYVPGTNKLRFQRLDISGDPVFTITRDNYIGLKTYGEVELAAICHETELGDNVTAGIEGGITQYVRDNPFWEMRDDVATLLEAAVAAINGLSLNQFVCENWESDYRLEPGDKIGLITEDGNEITTFLLNDVIMFDGTLAETTQWTYEASESESESNPTTLGEAIKKTYARVDKANQEIILRVTKTEFDDTTKAIESSVEAKVDKEGFEVTVSDTLRENEIDGIKIKEKNFAFNNQGLTISDTNNKDITTKIDETGLYVDVSGETVLAANNMGLAARNLTIENDNFLLNEEGLTYNEEGGEIITAITGEGMTISHNGEETLVANKDGVTAIDLHARTYLIIGENSRFEDWADREGNPRTACFWLK